MVLTATLSKKHLQERAMASSGRNLCAALLVSTTVMSGANAVAEESAKLAPLAIQEQGSFAVGGTVITSPGTFDPYKPTPEGQTFHGEHAYVFYQIPVNARKLPIVMWHGAGQFSKSWETTSDGREGYQNIFLRRGFGVYLIDQPRRGNAGRSTVQAAITPTPDEQVCSTRSALASGRNTFRACSCPAIPKRLTSSSAR
jgi:hypothetical protein